MRPLPSAEKKALLLIGTTVPPASRNATPRATPNMPSVPMNGGTRRRETSRPLTSPGMPATSTATRRAEQHGQRQRHAGAGPVDHMGRDHGGEPHDEADRQIDAARNDDEGLPGRQQQRRHRKDGDRLQVEWIEDEGAAEAETGPGLEADDQRGEEQPGAQAGNALHPGLGNDRHGRPAARHGRDQAAPWCRKCSWVTPVGTAPAGIGKRLRTVLPG